MRFLLQVALFLREPVICYGALCMHLSVAGREFLGLQLSVPRAVASEQSSAFACIYYRDVNHTRGPSSPLRCAAKVIETRHFKPKSKLQQGIGVKLLSSA